MNIKKSYMEENINIAEILKDKKYGIRLYSPIFGECTFCCVREDTNDICVKKQNGVIEYFNSEGLYFALGEVMLFPSKEMRDWSKFDLKKGDVLVSDNGKVEVIFEKFVNDTYQSFIGKHHLDNLEDNLYYQDEGEYLTNIFNTESKDAAQTYVKTLEEKLGGKLNRETLEVEKTQPEFKDGDVLFVKCNGNAFIKIFNYSKNNGDLYDHASLDTTTHELDISGEYKIFKENIIEIRLATEEEKQQLFDALAKKGKVWDAEKKKVVDIKKEHQFKPFEKVLVRDSYENKWRASFFSHIKEGYSKYVTTGFVWKFCIPYEGNEHLLGTTNNVEDQV